MLSCITKTLFVWNNWNQTVLLSIYCSQWAVCRKLQCILTELGPYIALLKKKILTKLCFYFKYRSLGYYFYYFLFLIPNQTSHVPRFSSLKQFLNWLFSINCHFLLQYNVVRTLLAAHVAKDCEFGVVCFNDAMTTGVAMILMNKKARTGYLANLEASSTMFLDRGWVGSF